MLDLNRLGALVTKTITRELRTGNPLPRVAEVQGGMLNAIGIPSKGVPYLLEHTLPDLRAMEGAAGGRASRRRRPRASPRWPPT